MRKLAVLLVLSGLFLFKSEAFAFGPGFGISFGGDGTTVSGYGIMNGSNSQGTLPLVSKKISSRQDNIAYYQLADGLFAVVVKNKNKTYSLEPFVSEGLEKNADVYKNNNAILSVNAGYFDPKNKQTISYVVKDGELIANPEENENLTSNEKLQPFLDKIYERSEFRVLQKGRKIKYDIAKHGDKVEEGWCIKHSIQGGPQLVPEFTAIDEYFLAIENGKVTRDAISVLHKAPRTVFGFKGDDLYIIIATTKYPMTLLQMNALCQKLGLEKAINFDGGGSTSFDSQKLHIVSDKNEQARKLKSFWLLK